MSTNPQLQSRLKDLVVTATVASLVTAIVGPMIRRWVDGGSAQPEEDFDDDADEEEPAAIPAAPVVDLDDDYEARAQRLFEFSPEAIPTSAVAAFHQDLDPQET